jgi:hypothetical protein
LKYLTDQDAPPLAIAYDGFPGGGTRLHIDSGDRTMRSWRRSYWVRSHSPASIRIPSIESTSSDEDRIVALTSLFGL